MPLAWRQELEAIAYETGQSLEQVVCEAVAQYLGRTNELPLIAGSAGLPLNEDTLHDCDDEPDEIMASFLESEGFGEKVRQAIAPSATRLAGMPLTYEEIEQEPDEILYEFLEP